MSGNAPTLINLPPPPEPVTPDIPSRSGTPNSTTTSMSELSTVAIKDGHRGHIPHHSGHPSSAANQIDAERADRISRLAGLERVATARNPGTPQGNLTPSAAAPVPQSYFDASGNPVIGRERSTVGSASATGSVGARTTWAGSEVGEGEGDKMSESQDMDMDMEASSVGGISEEGTGSLVGFGEGARTPARGSGIGSPGGMGINRGGTMPTSSSGMAGRDARMIDGLTYDAGVVDTTASSGEGRRRVEGGTGGAEEMERIVRDHMNTTSADRMRNVAEPGSLGKFGFEK